MTTLAELATVIRSKNAGALTLTLDVMFDSEVVYHRVVESGVLNVDTISGLYNIPPESIDIIPYPVANAVKISFPRSLPSGHPGDGDVYGAQQHALLLDLVIP